MSQSSHPGEENAIHSSRRLVEALDNPFAFGHPISALEVIETHISWVILTGHWAYKIKKPVNFGFLDFSSRKQRKIYCQEELRLNRRFAPDIYQEVVPVRGSHARPRLHGDGEVLDYAVKMRQFPQTDLISTLADRGSLEAEQIDAIATTVARVHGNCERAEPGSSWGSSESVEYWSSENLTQLQATVPANCLPPAWQELLDWYHHDQSLSARISARKRDGFVRECHGDLHLGNMVMLDLRVTLFDCIEFNPELRWIDTISEAAFVAMDLEARGFPGYCWRFLDRYLAASGDYAGIDLLRYYVVYRALVRAKVAALRVRPDPRLPAPDCAAFDDAIQYIELADRWAGRQRRGLVLMNGLSGSGKSTVAGGLVESLGAIRLRSDIERKRLHGLAADQASQSVITGGIYSSEASKNTYRRLAELATGIIDASQCAIVDAAFLHAAERQVLLEVARSRNLGCVMVSCIAPREELERRLAAREGDASEADVAVLHHQLQNHDPISGAEQATAPLIEVGPEGLQPDQVRQIETLLFD